MVWIRLIAIVLTSGMALAQGLPAGTVIPVMLSSGLNAAKDKSEKKIEGKVMQEVPLPSGRKIRQGSRVAGHVVSATKGPSGARLVLKFDAIQDGETRVPLRAALLAVASVGNVFDAQAPISLNSDVTPTNQWVTRQVGGDNVNRGLGRVTSHDGLVGTWVERSSVLATLTPNPEAGCPSGPGYDRKQAVWVFSSGACGVYGMRNLKIVASGSLPPMGEIALSSKDKLEVSGGSGWLLITISK